MQAPGIRSIYDPEVQSVINNQDREFYPSPRAWEDQVLYFLLVDRFSDGQETGFVGNNGKLVDTGKTPPYTPRDNGNAVPPKADGKLWLDSGAKFVGGNLKGATSKLGYLKQLGVTAVWVGPIFKQVRKLETYHGYAVQNFLEIDPRFGTREDLQEFVRVAHSFGLYVLLDVILNHTGDVFAYKDGNPVYSGKQYKAAGYYDADRKVTIPMGTVDTKAYPNAFPDGAIWPAELQPAECFTRQGRIGENSNHWDKWPEYLDGDFYELKDIQLGPDNPDHFTSTPALQILCQVYKYWIAYADVDGFRIDTVKHMGDGPTRYFASVIHEFAQSLGKEKFLLIGEIAGNRAFETVEVTGIDAALGIGGLQEQLWKVPKGYSSPEGYFNLFRNTLYLGKGSHTWFRDKVVTMIDDHDQIWRSIGTKARFCADMHGPALLLGALALNLCTLGIPCIYYGSEQSFDGSGGSDAHGHYPDQYIRETMFGGPFGAFRSRDRHFFNTTQPVYGVISSLISIRSREIALRRGRQFLREISTNGIDFAYPTRKPGEEKLCSVVAWSRIFNEVEILCAFNTDAERAREAWVCVDKTLNREGGAMRCIFEVRCADQVLRLRGTRDGRVVGRVKLGAGGVVLFKKVVRGR